MLARFPQLKSPSVSYGARQLYAHGIFEEETRPNLVCKLADLLREGGNDDVVGALLMVNDKRSLCPLRIRLSLVTPMGA